MDSLMGKQYGSGMAAYTLKTIAIVAMVVDHVAAAFVPGALRLIMRLIGRLTAPIMMYFVAEGYHHTKDVGKYALRLGVFALISHFPYRFFGDGQWPVFDGEIQMFQTSFMYSLFVGLLSLIVWNNDKLSLIAKAFLILGLCVAAIPGDGSFFAVFCILAFGAYRGDFKRQAGSFAAIAVIALARGMPVFNLVGMFLTIPLLKQYNGTLGGSKRSKWFFYIFYPLHLLVLGLLKYGV